MKAIHNVLIVGYGGVLGTLLSAVLQESGIEVYGVGKDKLQSLKKSIIIESKKYVLPKKHYSLPQSGVFDMVILATKVHDNTATLKQIKENNIKASHFILIQNGLLPNQILNEYHSYIGDFNTLAINGAYSFSHDGKEIIVHRSQIGWQIKNDTQGIVAAKLLTNAGIPTNVSDDIETQRASKFILNCLVSGLTSIFNMKIKELFHNTYTLKLLDTLFDECYAVLSAEGKYTFSGYDLQKEYSYTALEYRYGDHYSSMRMDVQRKKPTEIETMNGYIIMRGKKHGIATPMNTWIYNEIKKIEATYI